MDVDQVHGYCLTPNPRDKVFLKVCFVCHEKAKEGQVHIRNYGGVVCFSCRAFFRRANQKTRRPAFKCKQTGTCLINMKNRRECQCCRYTKCLTAGMDPELVLTPEQKVVRFRKLIKKKKREREKFSKLTEKQKLRRAFESTKSGSNHQRGSTKASVGPDSAMKSASKSNSKEGTTDEEIKMKIKEITRSYKLSLQQNCLPDAFLNKLTAIQSGSSTMAISKQEILDLVLALSNQFKMFASAQRDFAKLKIEDQKKLLERSIPLYIQSLIASYFNCSTASQQLTFLTDYIRSETKISSILQSGGNYIDISTFDQMSKLFNNDLVLNYFKQILASIKCVSLTSIQHRAILAYILLFHENEVESQDFKMLSEILCPLAEKVELNDLLTILSQMSISCMYNINWKSDDAVKKLNHHNVIMKYTQEEESWIQKQFRIVEKAFKSVPAGEEILEDFTMYALDVPLSKPFLTNVFKVGQERMKRVFLSQPEFSLLPGNVQTKLLAMRSFTSFALVQAKCELCPTGTEQLDFAFGTSEAEYWTNKYQSVFQRKEIRRLGILEACSQTLPLKPSAELCKKYKNLIEEFRIVCQPEFYLFVLLLVVTKPVIADSNTAILSKLNSTYKLLLNRRLKWKQNQEGSSKVLLEKILKLVDSVEMLSDILLCLVPHLKENLK